MGTLTYNYDADGRRTAMGGSLAAVNLPAAVSGKTLNAANAMTAFGSQTLTYDANGNLLSDGTNTYTWDARNHLTAIAGPVAASFIYDTLGRRIGKTIGGSVAQVLYDGVNPLQELSGGGTPTANLMTGLGVDEYFTRTDSSGAMSFLRDALGSTVALTDATGALQTQYTYEPFGNTTVGGPANANPYQFTGRENDTTGLYFYRARYYSPAFQRFVSQDPLEFIRSGHPYIYTDGNPISQSDPLGLFTYKNAGGPVNPNLASMLGCFEQCLGIDLVVTGAKEPSPPHKPGSEHNTGDACDLGKKSNPDLERSDFGVSCFEQCFNPFEEGVWGQEETTHFHIQDAPGSSGSVGFSPAVH